MVHIQVIIGSTRDARFGSQVADWVMQQAKDRQDAQFELVDLKEVALPFFDEPKPPFFGDYQHEHTKKWAARVNKADGFIFVTPEYNHGPSAVLKNALDFAGSEWAYKPVAFVSYGSDAGGARAVEHLRGNVAQLKMYDLKDQVNFVRYWEMQDEAGAFSPDEHAEKATGKMISQLAFWAEKMKAARMELAAKKA